MRAPAFWWREPGVLASALAPAAAVYGVMAARRVARPGARGTVPIICIGNMTVGGAGKTPTAIAVAARLIRWGHRPGFLLRGYGGRESGPLRVDLARHGPEEVGDEALLLARHAITIVSRDRPAGAALLVREGIDVVVMDDGMQNPSLVKDLTIAVVDGRQGHGNGRTLPAGPLRLPEASGWPLVDAALVVGSGEPGAATAGRARAEGKSVLYARLLPTPDTRAALAGRRVLAFAGIGQPEKFFETARGCGAILAGTVDFPDHHAYSAADIGRLIAQAEALDALPLTTEKDAVRLTRMRSLVSGVEQIATLGVTLSFDDETALDALLARAVASIRPA